MVLTPTTMAPPGFSHNFNDPTDDSLSNLSSGCYPRPTTMSSRLLLPPLYHDDITATAAASSTAAPTRQRRCTDNASDATLRPYDADDNVPQAIIIMRIGQRALDRIIRDGPAGFRAGATTEEKRRDFIRHIVDDVYAIGAGRPDFDHFTIRGKPSLLKNIIGLRLSVHSNPPK